MKETDNNFLSGSFRFLIFRKFDIGEIRRLVFFLGKAFFSDVFILLGQWLLGEIDVVYGLIVLQSWVIEVGVVRIFAAEVNCVDWAHLVCKI